MFTYVGWVAVDNFSREDNIKRLLFPSRNSCVYCSTPRYLINLEEILGKIANLVSVVRLAQLFNMSSMTAQGGLTHFSTGDFIIGERLNCARHVPTIVAQMFGEA